MRTILKHSLALSIGCLLSLASISASHAQLLGFEDVGGNTSDNISTTQTGGLAFMNNVPLVADSAFYNGYAGVYGGVAWDTRLTVVGKDYRTDTTPPPDGPSPLTSLGVPGGAGANYFITNSADFDTGDPATAFGNGILLKTNQVLTGAYFGEVQFYGYGEPDGTTAVSITAMHDLTALATLSFTLPLSGDINQNPPLNDGAYLGSTMGYFDTSSFQSLTGITGYVINRADTSYPGNAVWAADNFNFVAPIATPEPSSWILGLVMIGALGLAIWRRSSAQS